LLEQEKGEIKGRPAHLVPPQHEMPKNLNQLNNKA